ncbi:MAG: ATP-dependent DNA helicase, partial [Thermoplasmata archaeon]|nr:ATP-dependent DNA helicase [Thermoplasmata archaeon]
MPDSLFPYAAPRKGQATFLHDARAGLQGGILLAQAPTGLGKTAVALAASLEVAREEERRVVFATARRSQHRIAIETLRRIERKAGAVPTVDLVAREVMCPDHAAHADQGVGGARPFARTLLRRPLHTQEAVRLARRFGVCPYAAARRALRHAEAVVCDYNHLFDPAAKGVLEPAGRRRDLVAIVDEAHNLPMRARQALSHALTSPGLAALARAAGRRGRERLNAASRLLAMEARFVGGDSRVPPGFLEGLLRRSPTFARLRSPRRALLRELRQLRPKQGENRRQIREAEAFLNDWEEPHRLRLLSRREGGSLRLAALDPRPATEEVFRRLHAALLMSGTLHPGRMYADLLGLEPRRTRIRTYPSDFPPENRLLLVTPGLSLAFRRRPGAFVPYAREIARLCGAIPGNVAAFFPSYEVALQVGEALRSFGLEKRVIWERRGQSKAAKEGLVRRLQSERGGGCLLMAVQAGSLSEGIDYPGNVLQGVIVAGLSVSPPDLHTEALRGYYVHRFGRGRAYDYAYLYPALNRAIQCAGRCIRGSEDVAAVVILDARILRPSVRSRLPATFRPRVARNAAAEVRTFFYGGQHESPRAPPSGRRGPDHADRVAGPGGG